MSLTPSPLVSGPPGATLEFAAHSTNGSGAALQKIPKRTTRVVRVEINSMDRNYGKYPFSSEFVWQFPFPVKEVREVRLVGGTVPIPFLNIDVGWNKFTFVEKDRKYAVAIPPGYYKISTFCTELQTQLNGIPGIANTYSVSQVPNTGQIQIRAVSGTYRFIFAFGTGDFTDIMDSKTKALLELRCLARFMGFGYADYWSEGGVITAPRTPNMWFNLERTYLYLNFDTTQDLRSIFRGAGRKEPSAILYNDELNTYNFAQGDPSLPVIPLTKYLNKETFDTNIVPAPAPLSRIAELEVSLRDVFYNPINTQGRELSLLLELVIVD